MILLGEFISGCGKKAPIIISVSAVLSFVDFELCLEKKIPFFFIFLLGLSVDLLSGGLMRNKPLLTMFKERD